MHRNKLIELLTNYKSNYPEEEIYKKQILEFINKYPNCFERTLDIGHITASCWLLDKTETKALLMHHAKLDAWFQLGGHCDGNPDVLAVAIKEAQEESGIQNIIAVSPQIFDIDIHLIPERKTEKAHYHYDIRFLLKVSSDEISQQNSESKALVWIDKDQNNMPPVNQAVMRMYNKFCALSL